MRKKQRINRKKLYIALSVVVFSTIILLFNDFGLIQLFQLQQKKNELTNESEKLLNQQITLRDEIDRLQTDDEYIEKLAREKFMMVMPGEKIYRVKNEKIITIN